jgi:hypothetical protein
MNFLFSEGDHEEEKKEEAVYNQAAPDGSMEEPFMQFDMPENDFLQERQETLPSNLSFGIPMRSGQEMQPSIQSFGIDMEKSDKASSIFFRKETMDWENDSKTLHDELIKKASYIKFPPGKGNKKKAWFYIARETLAGKTTLLGMAKGEVTKKWNNLFTQVANLKIYKLVDGKQIDAWKYCKSQEYVFEGGEKPKYVQDYERSLVGSRVPNNNLHNRVPDEKIQNDVNQNGIPERSLVGSIVPCDIEEEDYFGNIFDPAMDSPNNFHNRVSDGKIQNDVNQNGIPERSLVGSRVPCDIEEEDYFGNIFDPAMDSPNNFHNRVSDEKIQNDVNQNDIEYNKPENIQVIYKDLIDNPLQELDEKESVTASNLKNIVTDATEMDLVVKSSESQPLPLESFKESLPQVIQPEHKIQLDLQLREELFAADVEKNETRFDLLDQAVEEKKNEICQGITSPSQKSKDPVVLIRNPGIGKSPILNGLMREVAVHSNNVADIQADQFEKIREEFSTKIQLLENNMKVLQEQMAQQQEKQEKEEKARKDLENGMKVLQEQMAQQQEKEEKARRDLENGMKVLQEQMAQQQEKQEKEEKARKDLENGMKVLQEQMAQQQEKARKEQERMETELKEEQKQQGELIDNIINYLQKQTAQNTNSYKPVNRCWGCGGGPGHPWSYSCRGNFF